jgi:hypothetical protein
MPEESAGQEQGTDAAIKERLRELSKTRWDGNLAQMARALRLPQPALWKMVNGEQPPSAKLLMALVEHTDVNPHWLVTGQGPRFLEGEAALRRGEKVVYPKAPVARQLLSGRPDAHPDLLDDRPSDPLGVFTPTQYWAQVKESDPIVRHKEERVKSSDWLLLETDPARFPPLDQMKGKLVVVQGRKGPSLARVQDVGMSRLGIILFDLRIDPSLLEEEIVIRPLPDGKLDAFTRKVLKERPRREGRRAGRRRDLHPEELLYGLVTVNRARVFAVCVLRVGEP